MITKLMNRKGLSLVEIILGIAIFGIISISLIPIFTFSFTQIFTSGHKTEALYTSQELIEKEMDGSVVDEISTMEKTISIKFGTTEIEIDGQLIQVELEYDSSGNKILMNSFKPD
ncbi:prepilin-type N-terminal cleavage/methylation domain-containing protein [Natronincola peptidivorans]|uniref:Prepilin-type N-terminal cleavage/methylation domain-containing protein n=1 Tax=Natronincola peptidivorans TaxID=426128 RepID=A0A1H9YS37_9FIRM|nr:prepilin-type N-terminal cleavage/methylation domain-containing protein [Natronincola peptidivorans]SES71446.1 prepilin-type N-terminal cleavage/methylation domain-containing protein [Natronincola peptidivorans]